MKGAHWGFRQEKKVAYTSVTNSHPVPQDMFQPSPTGSIVHVCLMVTGRTSQVQQCDCKPKHCESYFPSCSHYFSPHFCLSFPLLFLQYFRLISSFLSLLFLFPSNLYSPHTFSQHSFVLSPFLHSLNSLLHPYSPNSSSSFLHFLPTCLISSLPLARTSLLLPSSISFFVFYYLFISALLSFHSFSVYLSSYLRYLLFVPYFNHKYSKDFITYVNKSIGWWKDRRS